MMLVALPGLTNACWSRDVAGMMSLQHPQGERDRKHEMLLQDTVRCTLLAPSMLFAFDSVQVVSSLTAVYGAAPRALAYRGARTSTHLRPVCSAALPRVREALQGSSQRKRLRSG